MALTYTSAEQNDVAYRLFGKAYTSLTTEQKAAIDGGSTSASSGHAADAFVLVQAWSNFVQGTGADTAPDAARGWFVDEIVWRSSRRLDPETAAQHKQARDDSFLNFVRTYAHADSDDLTTTEGLVVSHANLRLNALSIGIAQPDPVPLTPESIDSAIRAAITRLWNWATWNFRRQPVSVGLATNEAVTVTPSVTYRAVLNNRFYYVNTTGSDPDELRFVDGATMSSLKARGLSAGRPQNASLDMSGGTLNWTFDRVPDQAYTLRGVVLKATPALVSSANITSALALIPAEFHDALRRLVVADLFVTYGRRDGRVLKASVESEIKGMLHMADDVISTGLERRADEREAVFDQGWSVYGFGTYLGGGM